ncbi:hypothetical protein GQ53DRAFT_750009 [Thozetella sp. PMI_491]|nr:hypothetical protein GQ53DRAFT_750009 [Thozetella sp. PMI_491]
MLASIGPRRATQGARSMAPVAISPRPRSGKPAMPVSKPEGTVTMRPPWRPIVQCAGGI